MSILARKDVQAMLQFLEDDSDIFVPAAHLSSSTNDAPPSQPTRDRRRSPEPAVTPAVAASATGRLEATTMSVSQGKHRDPLADGVVCGVPAAAFPSDKEEPTRRVVCEASRLDESLVSLFRLCDEESFERRILESDGFAALGTEASSFWRARAAESIGEAHKWKTICNNRELISSDLIKELTEANRSQRDELRQVLQLFQAFSGQQQGTSSIRGGRGGAAFNLESRSRKR